MFKRIIAFITTATMITVLLSVAAPNGVFAETTPNADILAEADASITSQYWSVGGGGNNGADNQITVGIADGYTNLGYMKFDVASYSGYGRAKISFWTKSGAARTIGIYGIENTDWIEGTGKTGDSNGLCWNNAPGKTTADMTFVSTQGAVKLGEVSVSTATRYDFDITEYFNSHKAKGKITIGFAEESGVNNNVEWIAGRTDTDSRGRKPYLKLALDVSALKAAISDAESLASGTTVGTGIGQCTQTAKDTFLSTISEAKSVCDSWSSTEAQISAAVTAVGNATAAFNTAVANNLKGSYEEELAKAQRIYTNADDKYTQTAKDKLNTAIAAVTGANAPTDGAGYQAAITSLRAAIEEFTASAAARTVPLALEIYDDTYINQADSDATNNNPSNYNLIVGNASGNVNLAYLKIKNAVLGEMGRAKLKLFRKDAASAGQYTLGIYGLSDTTWTGATLCWDNAPNKGSNGFGTGAVKIGEMVTSDRQYYEVDISEYYAAHNTDEYISIGVAMETPNTWAFLSQVENADPSLRPSFELGYGSSTLKSAMDRAQSLVDTINVGLGEGNCPQSAMDALETALGNAKTVYADYTKSRTELDEAGAVLGAAVTAFEAELYHISASITSGGTIAAGTNTVTVKVENSGSTAADSLKVYFVLYYNDGTADVLEDVDVKTVNVPAGSYATATGTIEATALTGRTLKVFVWDSALQPQTMPII